MSKRKLSKKQSWRIKKIQQERADRMQKRAQSDEVDLRSGKLGPEQRGLVVAHYGATVEVQPMTLHVQASSTTASAEGEPLLQNYRCMLRTNLDNLVTGDEVVWRAASDNSGVIVANIDRRSEILRPDRRGNLKAMAANIDQIIIVLSPRPAPTHLMIDRYLIAAELSNIRPLLLLNKADLLADYSHDMIAVQSQLDFYQSLGIRVLRSSTKSADGLEELLAALTGNVNIFVGQSGVGKSSLVNVLLPDAGVRVGGLSEHSGLGKHTTTTAQLYDMPNGGRLIDSPGIREFGLWHIDPDEIIHGMIEFQSLLGLCKFRNCQHTAEPGCAIKAAVEAGEISKWRLENYHAIRQGVIDEDF